jgi:hypothetical protein
MNMKKILTGAAFVACVCAGCGGVPAVVGDMGRSAPGSADISPLALHSYLARADLARPETVQKVMTCLRSGKTFRQRVRDQKNNWTLATVWIDSSRQNTLRIDTCRDETCPVCKGTGKRAWKNETLSRMPFDTRCIKCEGKGFLPNHVIERQYVLSAEDYKDREAAREAIAENAFSQAPAGTNERVAALASENPQERLDACLWLDQNYVRVGEPFQRYMPLLRKARGRDRNEKVMVWQFWAGKGLPEQSRRTYYRIYADSRSGKVIEKGFYPEQ